ncbi:MAG: ATP-binding protein, partial [Rhabdochlamydiaceae bacterium]
ITVNGQILPVEVKAGPQGKLKSLYQFMEEKKPPIGIRISEKALSLENGVVSIPFYMIHLLEKIVLESFSLA